MQSACLYSPGYSTSKVCTEKRVQQTRSRTPIAQHQGLLLKLEAATQRRAGSTRSRPCLLVQKSKVNSRCSHHWSYGSGVSSQTPFVQGSLRTAALVGAGKHSLGERRLGKRGPTSQRSRPTQASLFSGASSGGAKRGGLSITETDKISGELREAVLTAVERLGGRVTVGDVAAKAGVKVTEAERALKALAADANGYLEVSHGHRCT